MKQRETIEINFMTCSVAELKAAERKQARLENAGYILVSTTTNRMVYKREV